MNVLRMADLDLNGKRVLIREDLNVPVKDGKITSDVRIQASIPTIKLALEKGAKVMVMSHRGRPTEGVLTEKDSMKIVADYLDEHLDTPVRLVSEYLTGVDVADGEVVVFENVRCNVGEKANDERLSKMYADLCDVFVHDAFGCAHRAQASTHGVAKFAPVACAGLLLSSELEALGKALDNPARPMVAIVGGSKVSTKLTVLDKLSTIVDQLIVGGGIANTFIAATDKNVGKSLYEEDLIPEAKRLLEQAQAKGGDIPVPVDVITGKEFSENAAAEVKSVNDVADDDMIFDIGEASAEHLAKILSEAKTIVWNGPVGVFEFDQFGQGTETISHAIANSDAFSIAGGGDTVAAVDKYGIKDQVSYISTGGGAFLEFLEGKELPAVAILEERARETS